MTQSLAPFDPLDFLVFARSLAQPGSDERALRTAVGRAYYALFLFARGRTGITTGTGDAHGEVVRRVRRRDRTAGYELYKLRKPRNAADYELAPANPAYRDWWQNWRNADRAARRILPMLQRI